MVGESCLREIPVEDWTNLRALFNSNWPQHILPSVVIENYELLTRSGKKPNTKIWCLDGDWSDGTFVLQEGNTISFHTLQQSCDRLYTALILLDWSPGIEILPFHADHKNVVEKVRAELKLQLYEEYEDDLYTVTYWMSKEKSLLLDDTPPEDCEIREVSEIDAEFINKLWPHKTPESKEYIKTTIGINPSRGLYGKKDGVLISWILCHPNGVLLAWQTAPGYTGKGYGQVILKSMAKLKAQMGQDIIGTVMPDNVKAHGLFKKLNFTQIDSTYWTKTQPF